MIRCICPEWVQRGSDTYALFFSCCGSPEFTKKTSDRPAACKVAVRCAPQLMVSSLLSHRSIAPLAHINDNSQQPPILSQKNPSIPQDTVIMAGPKRASARQSTLSFKSRVTKPTANKNGKGKKTSKAAAAVANVSDNSQDSQQSEAVAPPSQDSQQSRTVDSLSQKPLLQESQRAAAAAAKLSKAAVKEYYHEILASRLCTPCALSSHHFPRSATC